MDGSHICWDKQLNVETGLKVKNSNGYYSKSGLCYLSFSFMIILNNTKFKVMMHSIQCSFYARFGNPVKVLLYLPNYSTVHRQRYCQCDL